MNKYTRYSFCVSRKYRDVVPLGRCCPVEAYNGLVLRWVDDEMSPSQLRCLRVLVRARIATTPSFIFAGSTSTCHSPHLKSQRRFRCLDAFSFEHGSRFLEVDNQHNSLVRRNA